MMSFQYPIALRSGWRWLHSKSCQQKKHKTNTTVVMRWINNFPALKPVQLVSVNRSDCVSRWSNSDDFCLSLVGSNPRACLPVKAAQMEGRGHRRRFVFHSPFSLLSRQLWDHLPSQIKGMFVPHICLCSQTIFVIKLRLSGIFQIPGWWHWALGFFFGLVAFSRGKCSLQKLLAVLWCVCGMKWRIEWVLLMFLMRQLRADPLCAGGTHKMKRWPCHILRDITMGRIRAQKMSS